jgi:antitoxin component of RelBE/YafQ-DinJ toxin-antitoxin module
MKKVDGKKKRKSPSRAKYEKKNPTVSARVPAETRDTLRVSLAKLGMTMPDALKVLAGELEVKVVPIDEARRSGYEEAKNLYMVTFPCDVCGKPIPITGLKAKEAARIFMTEHGWGHAKCHEQRR